MTITFALLTGVYACITLGLLLWQPGPDDTEPQDPPDPTPPCATNSTEERRP